MQPKSVLKNRKTDFDGYLDDEEGPVLELQEDSSRQNTSGSVEVTYLLVLPLTLSSFSLNLFNYFCSKWYAYLSFISFILLISVDKYNP